MIKLSQPHIPPHALAAMNAVVQSGQLVHGAECEAFEAALAAYLHIDHVAVVSSGTAALHLALLALDIGPEDAVIVPDFTFPATANAVIMTGATPVIADVDRWTYNISISALEHILQHWRGPKRLRAIIPVHEFGCPAEIASIIRLAKQYGLYVIEDAACALGAHHEQQKLGTWGDIGCFSFHPRKTLTTGEGGALATRHPELAKRIKRLRNHGMERQNGHIRFVEAATNYRLTNFQAALGHAQLPYLDTWIQQRHELAAVYREALSDLVAAGKLTLPAYTPGHSWQTYMVVLADGISRDRVIQSLRKQDIEANLGAQSLSDIGIYGSSAATATGSLLYRQGLALPFCEQYNKEIILTIIHKLNKIIS